VVSFKETNVPLIDEDVEVLEPLPEPLPELIFVLSQV
jgi:hypothetical protein